MSPLIRLGALTGAGLFGADLLFLNQKYEHTFDRLMQNDATAKSRLSAVSDSFHTSRAHSEACFLPLSIEDSRLARQYPRLGTPTYSFKKPQQIVIVEM